MRVWRTRAQTGFTIMEILVALTLLAVVMLLGTRAFLTIPSVTNRCSSSESGSSMVNAIGSRSACSA
jgi:prepilin-type N-terminal cleavage/methylation domain-containing protein